MLNLVVGEPGEHLDWVALQSNPGEEWGCVQEWGCVLENSLGAKVVVVLDLAFFC